MTSMHNLDELLASDNRNGSVIEIDDFICELCAYGEELDKLTEPQKQFFYNQNLEREINNGGFNQYFINSSGDFAHETILSLKAIGANKTTEILKQAIDQFPDKRVPKDRDERIELVIQIQDKANEIWGQLDNKFFEYQEDLNTLNLNYVRQNKNTF